MCTFLQNAESFEVFVFVKALAFVETFRGESVVDGAGRSEIEGQDCNNTYDNKSEESPPTEKSSEDTECGCDCEEPDIPPSVAAGDDVFFGLPSNIL